MTDKAMSNRTTRSRRRRSSRWLGATVALGAAVLTACGGGDGDAGGERAGNDDGASVAPAGERADATASPSSPVTTVRFVSGGGGGNDAAEAAPFTAAPTGDDRVRFVTTTSTTTTTTVPPTTTTTTPPTTTIPPTTTSTTTTTTSTTTTTIPPTTTSTTSTTLPPTMISCSLAADALFAPGSAELAEEARTDLVTFVGSIEAVRSVTITGHTDHRGTDADNLALSQARADAAAAALIDAGIDAALIDAVGEGERAAKQGSPTDEEMAADRRVDIVIDAEVVITASC